MANTRYGPGGQVTGRLRSWWCMAGRADDMSLWTLERYVQEVEEVRRGLGLDNFVLYGHSWGGILALEYALTYQQHLRGLVISDMAAGIQSYLKRTAALKQSMLPPDKVARL